MKVLHLAAIAAVSPLLVLAPAGASAQHAPPVALFGPPPPPQSVVQGSFGHGFHHGFRHGFNGGFFVVEDREVVHDVVVVHDEAAEAAAPPAPPPPARKPYVLGRTYASLPGACMKMVERAATYFYCSGEWYRQVGSGQYRAVKKPV